MQRAGPPRTGSFCIAIYLGARAALTGWNNWAKRPSYFKVDDKPLLLIHTDKNYGPGDFADPRFTMCWVYNGDNFAAMKQRKTWGWSDAPIARASILTPKSNAKVGRYVPIPHARWRSAPDGGIQKTVGVVRLLRAADYSDILAA